MATVRPIPEGYNSVTPFLVLEGAHKAIEFYTRAFGATETGLPEGLYYSDFVAVDEDAAARLGVVAEAC